MEVKTIVQEIQLLPLSKRFLVMEQTLQSIKNEELIHEKEKAVDKHDDEDADEKKLSANSFAVSEKSLAKDWLSEEDNRWDTIL